MTVMSHLKWEVRRGLDCAKSSMYIRMSVSVPVVCAYICHCLYLLYVCTYVSVSTCCMNVRTCIRMSVSVPLVCAYICHCLYLLYVRTYVSVCTYCMCVHMSLSVLVVCAYICQCLYLLYVCTYVHKYVSVSTCCSYVAATREPSRGTDSCALPHTLGIS